jgi:hypothetical protein
MVPKRDVYELARAFASGINKSDDVPPWDGGKFTSAVKDWEGVGDMRSRKLGSGDGGSGRPAFSGLRVVHGPAELGVDVEQVWWDTDPPTFDDGSGDRSGLGDY